MSLKFFTVASGSSGNSSFIGDEETKLLVDAGLSGKAIEENLRINEIEASALNGILVTHEHNDHIKGVGILSRRFDLPIYATEGTWQGMGEQIGKIADKNKQVLNLDACEEIGTFKVEVMATSHDANEPSGYVFTKKETRVAVVTDTGQISNRLCRSINSCNGLILEANHDATMLRCGKYPYYLKKRIASDKGHLSNAMAGDALAEIISSKTTDIILAHLSNENNLPGLALETVEEVLKEKGFTSLPKISIAPRYSPHPVLDISG